MPSINLKDGYWLDISEIDVTYGKSVHANGREHILNKGEVSDSKAIKLLREQGDVTFVIEEE